MNEYAILLNESAAAGKAGLPSASKGSASAESPSAGSLFFELLSSSLAGSFALQADQDASPTQITGNAAVQSSNSEESWMGGRSQVSMERLEQPARNENRTANTEDASKSEKPTVRTADEAARPDQEGRTESAGKSASGREAQAVESAAKPEAEATRSGEADEQTRMQAVAKPASEAMKAAVKIQTEETPAEQKPSAEISDQQLLKQAKVSAADAEKLADTVKSSVVQQRVSQNATSTGAASQAQEAPKPSNVIDITQLLNRIATKVAQDSVQPSTDSQSAQYSSDQASAQTTTALQEMMNAGAIVLAQAAKAAFSAALQAQTSASAQPAGQQSSSAVNIAVPAGVNPAARASETAGKSEAAPTSQSLPTERVINQVVRAASISVNQGREEIKLLLKPESLGWLKVKVSVEGQSVTARITVENEGVRDLLNANIKDLQQALNNQNLKVNQVVIELNSDAERQTRESADDGSKGRSSRILSIAGDEGRAVEDATAPAEEVAYRLTRVDLRV
jgi:flagellar hook-length control protein FliK